MYSITRYGSPSGRVDHRVYVHEVVVAKLSGRPGLSDQAAPTVGMGPLGSNNLDGDKSPQRGIVSPEDNPHPAASELGLDVVWSQRAQIVGSLRRPQDGLPRDLCAGLDQAH